jgi:uncharacterized membrane protein
MAEYTVQDYVIYLGILLLILWGFSRFIFKRIEFDNRFLWAAAPYIVFGVTLRMLADVGMYERNQLWNITPGVYITSITLGLIAIAIGLVIETRFKIEYWYTPLLIGIFAALFTSYNLSKFIVRGERILYPFILAFGITLAIYLLSSFTNQTRVFRKLDNVAIIYAHLLDGSATFLGIDFYHFSEEHLLPDIFIKTTGTAFIMIPLKILVALLAIYFLEKWYRDEKLKGNVRGASQQYKIFKFLFFILGIGPGLRDAILPATIV